MSQAEHSLKSAAGLGELSRAVTAGALRPLDLHLALWLGASAGGASLAQLLAATLASHRVGQGDVCLELSKLAGGTPFAEVPELRAPDLGVWRAELRAWGAVGGPGDRAPLILDGADRLYLGRYWHYERRLAQGLVARAGLWSGDLDPGRLAGRLDPLFPPNAGQPGPDWQRVAAAMALIKPFSVVSGGPGTGKTRTVAAILALCVQQALDWGPAPRIGLAAPTGKAAARLAESIREAKSRLLGSGALDPAIAAAIPEQAATLHRLLGTRPGRVAPRHGPDNPLHLDLLVLDEASMLDLPLAARLLDALPGRCRLILLGDRDQLASVQAGSVLGDICGRGREPAYSPALIERLAASGAAESGLPAAQGGETGIGDCIALLRRSFRFGPDSGIARLAGAVNRGDGAAALATLSAQLPDLDHLDLDDEALSGFVSRFLVPRYRDVLAAESPADALLKLGRFRVLCAVREGPFGVAAVNRLAEQALAAANLVRPEGERWAGRPLLVTANDYDLKLYNGDVGLLLADPESDGELRAFFDTADGVRRFSPHRLPPVETLFAMTVHKSQGSEFDDLALVLPRGESRAVTRELIYTGLTRARERVVLVAPAGRLVEGVARRVSRSSGLHDALWPTSQGARAAAD
jgi:exodeoxyribonuclease V alpha subunit